MSWRRAKSRPVDVEFRDVAPRELIRVKHNADGTKEEEWGESFRTEEKLLIPVSGKDYFIRYADGTLDVMSIETFEMKYEEENADREPVYCDGSGKGIYGFSFHSMSFPVVLRADHPMSSNELEYKAVLEALQTIAKGIVAKPFHWKKPWKIITDSALVYNQVMGNWKITEKFQPYVQQIRELTMKCNAIIVQQSTSFHVGNYVKEVPKDERTST